MRIIHLRQPILFALALCLAPIPLAAQQPPAPPEQAAPAQAAPAEKATPAEKAAEDNSIKEETIVSHVALKTHGEGKLEDGYARIAEAIARLRAAAQKAGLKVNGRPLAVFAETADSSAFKFDAMLPVDAPADAKLDLGPDVTIAQTPGGKALRFEHRGPYDDIDSTYDAIAAYLDAKGLAAGDAYSEEFLNDAKESSDPDLQVDIHVFLK
ncbi:GyrI-like domain-containing protein [Rhodoblastus sp.]|uniref:GyrI-like domain-containing protein n=1 Tax=Rhodoblastus sp. TaxID=1962975 RepID=UPI002633DD0F|nr:GyrI-like domain-containing protein [Rhodoblastus sp.]